jgi:DNA-damage-inducible protein D
MEHSNKLILFQENHVRRTWHNGEWFFVLEDVIKILTDSTDPKQYIKRMKSRDEQLKQGWVQIVPTLGIETDGGKQRMNCSNVKGILRIIQSIASPKVEPFKLWLAEVGSERILEIENPELAVDRARELYKSKGYSDEWINARLKSIEIRQELTDEWQIRGIKEGIEYSILTAEISRATFGMTPSEYRDFKSLEKENLRDHMTNMELIFTMLGEEATKRFAKIDDAQGFNENHDAALKGGTGAGKALSSYEKETGDTVITPDNFLQQIEEAKKNQELPPQ